MRIELALRDAVENNKDFRNFAGAMRSIASNLSLNADECNRVFGALADMINEWN